MKQFLLIFAFLMGYCLMASAEKIKLVPSAGDSTRMDTLVVSELSDVDVDAYNTSDYVGPNPNFFGNGSASSGEMILMVISVIMMLGLPLFIVAITLWFRYKNKQAKYRLAAEALAAGRSIPKELFNETNRNNEVMNKGIKNICLGIGLGVFLWIMTRVEGLAAIGFLVFCMGVGQVLIAYNTRPKKNPGDMPFTQMHNNEKREKYQKTARPESPETYNENEQGE